MEQLQNFLRRYFPSPNALVRVRVGQKSSIEFFCRFAGKVIRKGDEGTSKAGRTFLIRVEDLPAIARNYGGEKISASPAELSGGQCSRHVRRVISIAIDLDAVGCYATFEQVEKLQQAFPGAGVVWSNGVTLYYLLEFDEQVSPAAARSIWRRAVRLAFQIGKHAEKLTGLHFDRGTLVRKDGSPASHENHLYRLPYGLADRRKAPPQYLQPLEPNRRIADDSGGLNYSEIRSDSPAKVLKIKGQTGQKSDGSLAANRIQFSEALRVGRAALATGKMVDEAAEIASLATGLLSRKLLQGFIKYGIGRYLRKGPRRFTWPRNLPEDRQLWAHSSKLLPPQTRFDIPTCAARKLQDLRYRNRLNLEQGEAYARLDPAFQFYRDFLRDNFGSSWEQALYEDVSDLDRKFGGRPFGGCRKVHPRRYEQVIQALAEHPRNAPEIAAELGISVTHVKTILRELAAAGRVTSEGKTRDKKWTIKRTDSSNTVTNWGIRFEENLVEAPPSSKVSTPASPVSSREANPLRMQQKPRSPRRKKLQKLGLNRVEYLLTRRFRKTARELMELEEKNKKTLQDICSYRLPIVVHRFWRSSPAAFRVQKGRWHYCYFSLGKEESLCERLVRVARRSLKEKETKQAFSASEAERRAKRRRLKLLEQTERDAERQAALAAFPLGFCRRDQVAC